MSAWDTSPFHKRRQSLLDLAVSGCRWEAHSWLTATLQKRWVKLERTKPEVRPQTKTQMWPLDVELVGQKWHGDLGVMARASMGLGSPIPDP